MIPIFIPSYHRADNLKTAKYFLGIGWNAKLIYVFIDSEADDSEQYKLTCEKMGVNLVVFDIDEARARRSAGQARNMFQDFAKNNGIDFYMVQDDDTRRMSIRQRNKNERKATKDELIKCFSLIETFMRKRHVGVFGLSQSGDLIGGSESLCLYRKKVMNTTFYLLPYIYRGERGVQDDDTSMFVGIMNAGLFTGSIGRGIVLHQTPSATAKGGLTDLYNECKLLNKALVCPIQFPSAIHAERQKKNGGRLHHRINNRFLYPKIIKMNGRDNIAWDTYSEDVPFTNEPFARIK